MKYKKPKHQPFYFLIEKLRPLLDVIILIQALKCVLLLNNNFSSVYRMYNAFLFILIIVKFRKASMALLRMYKTTCSKMLYNFILNK